MKNQKLMFSFLMCLSILINIPTVLCMTPAPIVYVAGDGSGDFNCSGTNDQIQINQALQFVAENPNYTTVYLKGPFTYIVNDTLLIGNNTTLEGDPTAVIKLADNAGWTQEKSFIKQMGSDGQNITIRGFKIDGNREKNTITSGDGYYNFINLTNCQNTDIHHMYLTNNHGNGLKSESCSNLKFHDNDAYLLGHDVLYAANCLDIEAYNNRITCRTNSGLRIYNSNNVTLYNNDITSKGSGGAGIEIQKHGTSVMDDIEVYNNTIHDTKLAGIWIFGSGDYLPSSTNVSVHHNQIYNTGTNSSNNKIGGIVSDGFNVLVENNVIDGAYGTGIAQKNVYNNNESYSALNGSGYIVTAKNNIITNTQPSSDGENATGVSNFLTGTHSFVLENNCFYNNSGGNYWNVDPSTADIQADPLYADRDNHDYHLKSKAGRWSGSAWVSDSVNSPCIDAGYPFSDYSNEPEPNGDRVNIGPDGNTVYASKSDSSAPAPILPLANFGSNVTEGRAPLAVQFKDNITGAPTSWEWDFGDGSPNSTEQNPDHTYNSAGTYTVVLSAYNAEGNPTSAKINYIRVTTLEQASGIEWQKCLGGSSSDYGTSVKQTSDGGYIVVGGSYSNDRNVTGNHGSQDSWVVKLGESGDVMWQKCLGGSASDYGGSIEQTSDGGYIVAGFSNSNNGNVTGNHGSQDSWVVKLDESGDVVWQKCLGGSSSDYVHNIKQTSDGGYIAIGYSNSNNGDVTGYHGNKDCWVVKLDESGDVVWQKCLGGSSSDFGSSIKQTYDGGYILGGGSYSNDGNVTGNHGSQDSWVVKLDESGDVVWQKCLGGSASDVANCIEQTSDGGYVVSGYSNSNDGNVTGNHGSQDSWVVKLNESGDVMWQKCLGGSSLDYGNGIEQTSDGGYIVAGYSGSNDGNVTGNHGNKDCWVVKLDESGDVVWQKCLGGSSSDYGRNIEQTSDGGYIVIGHSNSKDGDVIGNHGNDDYWVVKLASQALVADFSAIPTSGSAPLSVIFTDNSTDNPTSWLWSFGDGANSVEQNPVHTYSTEGNYTVNLTVSNENGKDSKSNVITVFGKPEPLLPVANFSTNVNEGDAPLSVQFTDLSANADIISWDFNSDGISDSNETNPVYEFTAPGVYKVNLTATNVNGTASKSATINVTEKLIFPVANFSANVTSGYAPLSVQFIDASTGVPTAWEWNFGDGSPDSTEQNPGHTYSSAGAYTVVLNASNNTGYSTDTQTNYIKVLNNSNSGSLTLANTNLSQLSSIPRGMYPESNTSNVTLTYNNTLKCADITYTKPAIGSLFFTNLYPTTDSNITYTLGTEGVSSNSYLNIVTSNSLVAVSKRYNGDYRITSYWIADDESTQYSYITVPAANIVDNKVTFSVVCYESNRTNIVKHNDKIYTKTPFRTINTRKQNYVFVNQPMVYFSSRIASGDTGPFVLHLYSIKQEIPRKVVTPYGTRSISALTITYPDPQNNGNGINLMKSNGQKSTIYVDTSHLDPATVAYEKELLDAGWEMGIHYTRNFNSMSNESAIATMDSEYNTAVNTFGRKPKTWVALGSSGNISQAIYAYQRYGMIWRSCESGASWLSHGNLCNPYWKWWNTSIAQGVVFPASTIATDKEPVTGSSINASYFTIFSNGFKANNIRLCGLNEYYFTQSAQNTTQVNIKDSNNSYMRFTVNTSGYPCTLNVMTDISNVEISHDGVTVPYTSVDDGVVFTAANNSTYVLRALPSLPVANFTSNLISGNVPFTVQFNDTSAGSPTSWDWNFGDGTHSSMQNATHTFTTPGLYNVTLTVSKDESSSTITKTIAVLEEPLAILPVANFSINVSEGYAPLIVQFNDLSANADTVAWDFDGDGSSDSGDRNPVHEFTTPGTYTVNLTVSNGNGTNSTSASVNISEKPVLPVANFSSNISGGSAPLTVQFTDSSENAAGVTWDFNDDGTVDSTSRTPVHVYDAPGTYKVNLTAINENGRTVKTASIIILERSSSGGGSSSVGRGSSGGSGAGSSHEPAKNVEVKELSQAFVTGGEQVEFHFPRSTTSILSITFDSKKTAGRTTTIVEMLKDKSTLTPDSPEGEVYGYLNIWAGNSRLGIESNIENAVICFRVEKSWIEENDIDQASIVLNRYNDSKWSPLPTSLSGEDERYLYFTAETPGFSPFAITGKTTATRIEIKPETNVSEQNGENHVANVEQRPDQEGSKNTSGKDGIRTPGFEAVYGITGLLAVFQYRKKQK